MIMRDIPQHQMMKVAIMAPEEQRAWLAKCNPETLLAIDAMFETWAHSGQTVPSADGWRVWMMMAGRGFGKTRTGAEWINQLAWSAPKRRIALIGATLDEARAIMVEGQSGIFNIVRRRQGKIKWEASQKRLTWPNGSVAELYSGDSPDGLRGPEFHFAWCDELAKWRQAEAAWAILQFGLRLGIRPRALITTTPRPRPLINEIQAYPNTVTTGGRTGDNISLPDRFVEAMVQIYGGTRLGRQEIDGELMTEAEGSLFPRALIERCRTSCPQKFERIVVGVDPPVSAGENADACGIVVAGRAEGKLYVLADATIQGASPERWARAVAGAAEAWEATLIVAEANQGGEMVRSVIEAAGGGMRINLVHASRGKVARAEPVATRFEAGRAFFAGVFPELEAELAGMSVGGTYQGPSRSPDRADAMVWAMTELGESKSGVPRVRML